MRSKARRLVRSLPLQADHSAEGRGDDEVERKSEHGLLTGQRDGRHAALTRAGVFATSRRTESSIA